ncbi:hypothetical protein FGG79_07990 [Bacillus sp. BHET2]|uniref:hypothetical protein n=1 Tax=Bacillus sp. BHET2 TaxID=2583818 RepID=UPI00110EB82D|nr:hypothetical protein [Bacillus sp. BHET2]TMU88037.1 hypothetical protein FGG79_07990 [Bacillus sp. BHET2]
MDTCLLRSLMDQRPIEIIYMTSKMKCTKRRILVKKVEKEYIMAYCFLREDIRRFNIQDILASSLLLPHQDRTIS